jgi:transposase InsO family protein
MAIEDLKMKYTVIDISRALNISRSTLYYKASLPKDETLLIVSIQEAFKKGKQTYGTRRIQAELRKVGIIASRRKISKIMIEHNLVSVYTKVKYKHFPTGSNEEAVINIVARNFNGHRPDEVIVSDLTYFRIGGKWYYLCPLLDLCGRRLIGFSVGRNKTAELIQKAFHSVRGDLRKFKIFHTDRGKEFANALIDGLLSGFSIQRSLSRKGNPYDNAVIESFNKTIKTDFINRNQFVDVHDFTEKMDEYMEWYNNVRIHSSLGYLAPNEWVANAN